MKRKILFLLLFVFILLLLDFNNQKSLFKDTFSNGIHVFGLEVQKKCFKNQIDKNCLNDSLLLKKEIINYLNATSVSSNFIFKNVELHYIKKELIIESLSSFGLTKNLVKDHRNDYFDRYKILGFPTILKKYTRYLFFKKDNMSYLHKNFNDSFQNIDAIYVSEVSLDDFFRSYFNNRFPLILVVISLFGIFIYYTLKEKINTKTGINKNFLLNFLFFINILFITIRLIDFAKYSFINIPNDNYFFWVHDKIHDKYNELFLFLTLLVVSFILIIFNSKFKINENISKFKKFIMYILLISLAFFASYNLALDSTYRYYEFFVSISISSLVAINIFTKERK